VVRVYDLLLHTATSPLLAQVFDADILGPHTAETKVAQVAKALLQHQPFNGFGFRLLRLYFCLIFFCCGRRVYAAAVGGRCRSTNTRNTAV
jgi:hypothetical protein